MFYKYCVNEQLPLSGIFIHNWLQSSGSEHKKLKDFLSMRNVGNGLFLHICCIVKSGVY